MTARVDRDRSDRQPTPLSRRRLLRWWGGAFGVGLLGAACAAPSTDHRSPTVEQRTATSSGIATVVPSAPAATPISTGAAAPTAGPASAQAAAPAGAQAAAPGDAQAAAAGGERIDAAGRLLLGRYGGHTGRRFPATGYFTTGRDSSGQWWLVDPEGNAFYAAGVSYVNPTGYANLAGQQSYLTAVETAYGKPINEAAWVGDTVDRLRAWGYNTVGPYSTRALGRLMPFCVNLGPIQHLRDRQNPTNDRAKDTYPVMYEESEYDQQYRRLFFDVFHPLFQPGVREYVASVVRENGYADDRRLIGYLVENEAPFWYGRSARDGSPWFRGNTLADVFVGLPPTAHGKQAWLDFLRETYRGNVVALNAAWGTSFIDFDALATLVKHPTGTPAAQRDRTAFLRRILHRYFSTVRDAIRAVDPHHMYLGARFVVRNASNAPELYAVAAEYADVISLNYYAFTVESDEDLRREMAGIFDEAFRGKPLLISEYSFHGRDSGMPAKAPNGALLDTQEERAQRAVVYRRAAIASPHVVGDLWWDYMDPPAEGSTHGSEDSNLGIVGTDNRPYLPFLYPIALQNRAIYATRGLANPAAQISTSRGLGFTLAAPVTSARVEILDGSAPRGARVKVLATGPLPAGWNEVRWDRTDEAGRPVKPGRYYYIVKTTQPDGQIDYAFDELRV